MSKNKAENGDFVLGCLVVSTVLCALLLTCGGCGMSFFGGLMPNYSEGVRTGTLLKISHKGIIFKSYEGELILNEFNLRRPGQEAGNNVFEFSSIDPEIAKEVESMIGQKVNVHYRQYLIGPIQQSTSYTITKIEAVRPHSDK